MDHFRHRGTLVGIAAALAMLVNTSSLAVDASQPNPLWLGGLGHNGNSGVEAAQLPPTGRQQPASASVTFSGYSAMVYAERYALSYNSAWPNMNPRGGDCANFVSQALFAGGHPQRATNVAGFPYTPAPQPFWYMFLYKGADGGQMWMFWASWVRPADLATFETSVGRGYKLTATPYWAASPSIPQNPSGLSNYGDLVLYDWGDGKGISHVAITVGSGRDNYNGCTGCATAYGTLVDAHNSDRYHVIWHLNSVNPKWKTTYITLIHLYPNSAS